MTVNLWNGMHYHTLGNVATEISFQQQSIILAASIELMYADYYNKFNFISNSAYFCIKTYNISIHWQLNSELALPQDHQDKKDPHYKHEVHDNTYTVMFCKTMKLHRNVFIYLLLIRWRILCSMLNLSTADMNRLYKSNTSIYRLSKR